MTNGRHLEMINLFSFLDDPFSMSISQLKEKLLPAADPKHHWFWRAFGEKRISLRDLIGGSLNISQSAKFFNSLGRMVLYKGVTQNFFTAPAIPIFPIGGPFL